MYISIDTGCPVAENSFASPAATSTYLTLFLNLQMETDPVLETQHLHCYFFFTLYYLLSLKMSWRAEPMKQMTSKKTAYCVLLAESLLMGKSTATYNYQRTVHLSKVKHFVKFEVW